MLPDDYLRKMKQDLAEVGATDSATPYASWKLQGELHCQDSLSMDPDSCPLNP